MATRQSAAALAASEPAMARKLSRDEALAASETPLPTTAEPTDDPPDDSALHTPLDSSRRRMPEKLRRFLLRVQGGKFYLPAAYRLVWFRDECPDWGVTTELIEGGHEAGFATVKATVHTPEGRVIATGMKTETRQDFPAGWVEKAETGSIARALAVAGFGTQFSPELDDESFADSPQPAMSGGFGTRRDAGAVREESDRRGFANAAGAANGVSTSGVWEGPGQCPACHAPAGKRHGKPCAA